MGGANTGNISASNANEDAKMDAKTAVAAAKNAVAEYFGEEGPTNIGLEELEFDEASDRWLITVGFTRSWDARHGIGALADALRRTYKVVVIDSNGKAVSIKNREVAGAF